MAFYLFSQILKFTLYSIKLIEKLSRRHLINSFDVFVIKGFTVFQLISGIHSTGCPNKHGNSVKNSMSSFLGHPVVSFA